MFVVILICELLEVWIDFDLDVLGTGSFEL